MRKTFVYRLLDGKEYEFSERNREDLNYLVYQNQLRAERCRFIYDNIKDETDRLALLRLEMEKIYNDVEVGMFILGNYEEQLKLIYASFKVKNNLSFDEFRKLVDEKMVRELGELIRDIERPEEIFDEVITNELGISQKKLSEWAKEQPRLYKFLKQAGNLEIKKKETISVSK